jgi:hypothetical protein
VTVSSSRTSRSLSSWRSPSPLPSYTCSQVRVRKRIRRAGRARGQVAIQCAARRKTSRLKRVGGAHRRRRTVTRGGGWSSSATRRCWGHGGSLAAVSSERIQHRLSRCFLVLSLGVPRCILLFCLLWQCCFHLAKGLAPSLSLDAVGRSSLATWQY